MNFGTTKSINWDPYGVVFNGLLARIVKQIRNILRPIVFEVQSLVLKELQSRNKTYFCWTSKHSINLYNLQLYNSSNSSRQVAKDMTDRGGLYDSALLMSWWKIGIELVDLNSSALASPNCHTKHLFTLESFNKQSQRLQKGHFKS